VIFLKLKGLIREHLLEILRPSTALPWSRSQPLVVLVVVGVNGQGVHPPPASSAPFSVGGPHQFAVRGRQAVPGAAAIEQLRIWAAQPWSATISKPAGSDPQRGVLFGRALQAARARKVDCVIVDTAGRVCMLPRPISDGGEPDKIAGTARAR
jgi:signal recognition particle GTPase